MTAPTIQLSLPFSATHLFYLSIWLNPLSLLFSSSKLLSSLLFTRPSANLITSSFSPTLCSFFLSPSLLLRQAYQRSGNIQDKRHKVMTLQRGKTLNIFCEECRSAFLASFSLNKCKQKCNNGTQRRKVNYFIIKFLNEFLVICAMTNPA